MSQQIEVPGMGVVEFPDGMSDAQITAAIKQNVPEQSSSTLGDVVKSGAAGLGKGTAAALGSIGDVAELSRRGGKWLAQKAGVPEGILNASEQIQDKMPSFIKPTGSSAIRKVIESVTGEFHKPETTAGKYAETAGEFAPSLVAPGGPVRRVVNWLLPAAASEAAGQATEGQKIEPYARVAAAMAGGVAPSALGRLVTPAPASPARQRLVDILNDEGVTSLTAGQRTGNESLRYAESVLGNAPFSGQQTSRIYNEGREQFTDAALRRAGTGGAANADTLAANQTRLGDTFRDLSARNTLQMDQQFAGDVSQVIREYGRVLPSEQRQQLYNIIQDLGQLGNQIPGEIYQSTRSRLSRIASDNGAGKDAEFGRAMGGLRDALDNAMGRSVSPADQQAWQTARREYGAQKIIEKAASRAGEATAEGQIVPANLRGVVAQRDPGAYARGEGDFADLARAGAGVMGQMPQSGTAPRSAFYSLANLISLGIIPAGAGRTLMSAPVQSYLSNQTATPMLQRMSPGQAAVVSAMIAAEQQRAQLTHQ